MRTSYSRRPASTGPRANKFAGDCASCGLNVPAGAGILTGSRAAGWTVKHAAARWHGSPVSGRYVGGCPEDTARQNLAGQWGPYAEPRCSDTTHAEQVTQTGGCGSCSREVTVTRAPDGSGPAPLQADEADDLREVSRLAGGRYAYTASGARMTMTSRRCEDAPCCGCCD